MTSHEWAQKLKETAEFLLTKPEVKMENKPYVFAHFWDKETFLAAVRAMGTGGKKYTEYDFQFEPTGTVLTMSIPRKTICRKVQEEKWECDPILSEEEVSAL